jgi:hypothetical protein
VELVDPLSTNEAFESIGMICPIMIDDHLPCVLMNTRRRAHGYRGRAKLSLMISIELQFFFENLVNQILNLYHIPREPLAFYMRRCTC